MEKPKFLSEKYADLPGSRSVERAVQKKLQEGEAGPTTKEGRIEAYLDRLEGITEDDRGFELLKRKVLDRFTINASDDETLARLAQGLYESEKRMAIEQGRGTDIKKFESKHDIVEYYKPLVLEKEEIQRKTLSAWLDYLQENDAKQPNWFRYLVVRSLEKMGTLDKEKLAYGKRGATTVAPFPELNSEALGWAFKRLDQGIGLTDLGATTDMPEEELEVVKAKQEAIEKLIEKKDFAGLYAFAQAETAGNQNRESLQGEWRKYDKGSDFRILENDLQGKGTGWCTAEGSAREHLAGGDFYVYYTKTASGYTAPRVAIRMEGDSVGEVRGVSKRQELEPELVDVAQAKYHELPGGESYDKKAHDMKKVTELVKKQEERTKLIAEEAVRLGGGLSGMLRVSIPDYASFTKEELTFLYELNAPIEGFGYQKDPRIKALRDVREVKADLPILFDCAPEDIAHSVSEIGENTKAYIGPLEPGIFDKLPHGLEHFYTKFPEGEQIKFKTIELGTKIQDGFAFQKAIEERGIHLGASSPDMLKDVAFRVTHDHKYVDIVEVSVAGLGFSKPSRIRKGGVPADKNMFYPRSYDAICARAKEFGLELCPAEVGPQLRLQYIDQLPEEYLFIAMDTIRTKDGSEIFIVFRSSDGEFCFSSIVDRKHETSWNVKNKFVFLRPRK